MSSEPGDPSGTDEYTLDTGTTTAEDLANYEFGLREGTGASVIPDDEDYDDAVENADTVYNYEVERARELNQTQEEYEDERREIPDEPQVPSLFSVLPPVGTEDVVPVIGSSVIPIAEQQVNPVSGAPVIAPAVQPTLPPKPKRSFRPPSPIPLPPFPVSGAPLSEVPVLPKLTGPSKIGYLPPVTPVKRVTSYTELLERGYMESDAQFAMRSWIAERLDDLPFEFIDVNNSLTPETVIYLTRLLFDRYWYKVKYDPKTESVLDFVVHLSPDLDTYFG